MADFTLRSGKLKASTLAKKTIDHNGHFLVFIHHLMVITAEHQSTVLERMLRHFIHGRLKKDSDTLGLLRLKHQETTNTCILHHQELKFMER